MKVTDIGPATADGHCDRPLMDCEKGSFRYVLSCGHVLNRTDRRRWVRGELCHPKTIKCPVCDALSVTLPYEAQQGKEDGDG